MLVTTNTALGQVKKHLKDNYSLGCILSKKRSSQKHNISEFELKDDVSVRATEQSLSALFDQEVKLCNSDGYSVPAQYTLAQAKDDVFQLEDDHNFNTKIEALKTISNSSSYSDIDWVKRVFIQALRDAQTSDHFKQIEEMLDMVSKDNEKFGQSDFDEILNDLNNKKIALKV